MARIANVVRTKYPDATMIDIGANIGDSAALLCAHEDVPVLAIEGNDEFLPILRENARRLGEHVEIWEGYIGPGDLSVDVAAISTHRGTSSLADAVGAEAGSQTLKELGSVVAIKSRFADSRLIKIDTDGLDFDIIVSSLPHLKSTRPVLFFEYHTGIGADAEPRSLLAIESLMSIGYDRFIIYDNFGNFLLSTDRIANFEELNVYLRSNREFGIAVHYLDVCGFHSSDHDLFETLRSEEMRCGLESTRCGEPRDKR